MSQMLPIGLSALENIPVQPFLSALIGSSTDAIIGKTNDGVVVLWNEAAERLYGYTAEEMIGEQISILIPADRPSELQNLLSRAQTGDTVRDFHTERLRKDGTTVSVSITVSPVVDPDGVVLGMSTIAHDMTLTNLQIADLREAHRLSAETMSTLHTLHGSAPVGLGFVDREFRLIHLNEVLAAVNGSSVEQLIGRTVAESAPEIWPQVESMFRHVLEDNAPVLNIEVSGEMATDPGRQHHWLSSYYPVRLNEEVIGVGIVAVDITERRKADEFRSVVMNNMAEGLMTIDARGLLTSMNRAASEMLGWSEDELLGQVLDHFIMAKTNGDETLDEGNRQLSGVRVEGHTVQLDDHAFLRKNGTPLSIAISASPLILGGSDDGAVFVFRDTTQEKSERLRVKRELAALTWVGRIREALDEDRLVLYSQPIFSLKEGRPSEELLLRMVGRHADELITPDSFLGVAEKYGLITEIDQWVVKQAVGLAAAGRHIGANLSAESIVNFDMVGLIEAEITKSRADPSNLVFEITETALMQDIDKGHAFAQGILDLGCGIALDDFGTGYGTFTHVKKLAINYLKIDIEFVRGLTESSANQHVVKAIVNLAQGFNCETIAEGVEDAASLELLKEYGVDFAQGYYLGRPAPLVAVS